MSEHKFKVGQSVSYTPHRINISSGPGKCKILRLLATDGDNPQYRVKCTTETFERVVWESELG
jgi:hypothetical protein